MFKVDNNFEWVNVAGKFSIKDFFSKCVQISRKPQIWSHLLKNSFMENFTFCIVKREHYSITQHLLQNDGKH